MVKRLTPNEQYELGLIYKHGRGVPRSYRTARLWFRKAADRGHAEAQYRLGEIYHYGHKIPINHSSAFGWYQEAAEQGHAKAQNLVGIGLWPTILRMQALDWWKKAADQGHKEAEVNLSQAIASIKKAANEGNDIAQRELGDLLSKGIHVPKDLEESRIWHALAEKGKIIRLHKANPE